MKEVEKINGRERVEGRDSKGGNSGVFIGWKMGTEGMGWVQGHYWRTIASMEKKRENLGFITKALGVRL